MMLTSEEKPACSNCTRWVESKAGSGTGRCDYINLPGATMVTGVVDVDNYHHVETELITDAGFCCAAHYPVPAPPKHIVFQLMDNADLISRARLARKCLHIAGGESNRSQADFILRILERALECNVLEVAALRSACDTADAMLKHGQ